MLVSAWRVRQAFQQKRYSRQAVKVQKAFQVLRRAWGKAGGLEECGMEAGVNSLRDSVMRQELGGQTAGLAYPARS